MQRDGKVMVGCDAGQVVAGNAITHIGNYIASGKPHGVSTAFFCALLARLAR